MSNDRLHPSAPLEQRIRLQAFILAEAWRVWMESMCETYFPDMDARSADALLRCVAEGASRYARAPDRMPRAMRRDQMLKMIASVNESGRDGIRSQMEEMLAIAVQSACRNFADGSFIDPDVRAILPSVQVSAMRAAAARMLSPRLPEPVALDALDHYLREGMPAGVVWWDDPDRGAAQVLGFD